MLIRKMMKIKTRETKIFFLGMASASFFYYIGNDESIAIPRRNDGLEPHLTRDSVLEYIMFLKKVGLNDCSTKSCEEIQEHSCGPGKMRAFSL
jgi:hypothetical protein